MTAYNIKLIVILFFISLTSFAEEGKQSLTLEDCISSARENNEVVKMQLQKIKQAEQRISQAKGAILPTFSFNLQTFLRGRLNGTAIGQGVDSWFILTQPLFYGFRDWESLKLAKTEKLIEELELKDLTRKIDSDVASAFYQVAEIASDLKNTNDTLAAMSNRRNELRHRVKLGKSRESELFMLDSQIAVLRSNLQKISNDYARSVEALSFLINIDTDSIKINDTTPEPKSVEPLEKFIGMAGSRSDLIEANEEIKAQEQRVKISKGAHWPSLDLSGSLSGVDWNIYLLLNIPLFQGGIVSSKVKEELSKLQESREFSEMIFREIKTEIRQMHASLKSCVAQVATLKDAYVKAQKSYELQLKDYQLGLVNNLDVIQATFTLLDVKNNLDKSILQAKLCKALLDIATR